jgi:tRNA dimethylallyltransferase
MSGSVAYAIVGPTAAGKTKAAFELARRINGEVISVDSRQVYRYLDIGTDKISHSDRRLVPHHLIDIADPDEIFTAADFVARAEAAARRIEGRGKVPVLAGGTPFYFKALEGVMLSESLSKDSAIRAALANEAGSVGMKTLHDRLRAVDPTSAARIHPNDGTRIIRALEIFEITGKSATEYYAERKKIGGGRKIRYFGVACPRELLYERIASRVEAQFHSGYPEEVRWLLGNGYSRNLPALRGFGYRELIDFEEGRISFEDALAGDVRSTKAYARRQMTWFRQFSPIIWYDLSARPIEAVVEEMAGEILRGRSK